MNKQEENKEFKFHVIELLKPPYIDPEKYVCVPNSWIMLRETSDGIALVKFPIEELSEVKKRAAKKQEVSENWTVFSANIKYSTNSYKGASSFIKKLNEISDQEQSSMEIVEDVPSTSDKNVLESQSSSETNKVRNITLTINSDAEPVSKEIPKQLDLTDAQVRIGQKKSKGTSDSSPEARKYFTRQLLGTSLSGNNTVSLPGQTIKENLPKTSHCVEESDKTRHNQENEPSAKNHSELIRKWTIIKALRLVFGDNFKEALEKLHSEFEKNQSILEKMRLAFMGNCKIIKQLIELTDEVNNGPDISNLDSVVKELENSMREVNINLNNVDKATGSKVQDDTRKKEENKHNSDDTDVKNNNPLNKIRSKARKFSLPPEYDPNDSRWTLKHREMKCGLVELLPSSRVYVDAIKLRNCKIMSKDSKTLARTLLLEIFTENALSIIVL